MNSRLCHDASWAITTSILEVFALLLSEEEQREAFAVIYERIKAGIECMEIMKQREETRLKPSRN